MRHEWHEHEFSSVCPYCGKQNEMATGVHGTEKPVPGNVSVCIVCSKPGVWDENMQLRQANDGDWFEWEFNDEEFANEIRKIMLATKMANEKRRKNGNV